MIEADTDALEAGDYHIEFTFTDCWGQDLLSLVSRRDQLYHPETWQPFLKLVGPVAEHDFWGDNEMRSRDFLVLLDESEDRDGLYGLA